MDIYLKDLIKTAKPNILQKRYYCENGVFKSYNPAWAYFWIPGDSEPRIKWLTKQSDKLDYKTMK